MQPPAAAAATAATAAAAAAATATSGGDSASIHTRAAPVAAAYVERSYLLILGDIVLTVIDFISVECGENFRHCSSHRRVDM